MLISKMYNFMGLFCVVLELWPFEDEKMPVFPEILILRIFRLQMPVTQKRRKIIPIKLYISGFPTGPFLRGGIAVPPLS